MNKHLLISIFAIIFIGAGAGWTLANKPADKDEKKVAVNQMPVVTSGENPLPGSAVHDLPVEPAAAAARKDLAAKLSVDEKAIVILSVYEHTWNDGCLGLGGPAESCLMALVDGFHVELLAEGETYVYRTDKTGSSIRMEE